MAPALPEKCNRDSRVSYYLPGAATYIKVIERDRGSACDAWMCAVEGDVEEYVYYMVMFFSLSLSSFSRNVRWGFVSLRDDVLLLYAHQPKNECKSDLIAHLYAPQPIELRPYDGLDGPFFFSPFEYFFLFNLPL
uniref:Uncharacterized protein n=1 Tax=Trypanosoma congolense (strain IL3000) TaxID=1068625 RepID=G0V0D3_TRYCI|nr:hypothetical protein, unlikely [Trypanosoma congolense IL3000]